MVLLDFESIFGYIELGEDTTQINKFLQDGYHIVSCDASYKNGLGSCSIKIKNSVKEYVTKSNSFRATGPVESEMKAMLFGLIELKKIKGVKKVLITNDSSHAISLIVGNHTARKYHIKKVKLEFDSERGSMSFPIKLALVKSKLNKGVDKSAKKKLRAKEAEIENRIKGRAQKISGFVEKSKNLKVNKIECETARIKSENSEKEYVVSFSPPSCTCGYWTGRWGGKDQKAIMSRALPCKHMCKAAEVLGKDIYQVFRKQIFNRF